MSYHFLDRLEKVVEQHDQWRLKECLNMIPAENRGSSLMRSMLATDFGGRYSAPDRFYRGTRFADELLALCAEVARKAFNARYADVSPLSGHTANLAVLLSLTKRGDRLISASPDNGGYPGISHQGLGKLLELENTYFPYDEASVNIDVRRSLALIREKEPKLVVFGSSFIPFPHPVRELADATDHAINVYDGSHVLGLIAGGEFQDPLREGCSLLIGSTHKSLPGPQGGIILSNNEDVFSKVSGNVFPGVVDNVHLNRVAALTVALTEMVQFGKAYAKAVVENSKALAKGLAERDVNVKGSESGYTKSHQVLLDYGPEKLVSISGRLEQANIISDVGGRLGTQELTRTGYGPEEMDEVADLVAMVVNGKKPTEFVKKGVRSLAKRFQDTKYVLRALPEPLQKVTRA